MVWYDAEGRDPSWLPEEFEKVKSGRWVYHGSSTHFMNAHIEVSDNGILNFISQLQFGTEGCSI